jgi:hypothetical protein
LFKEALSKWVPVMPFDKLRTGLSKDLIRASLIIRSIICRTAAEVDRRSS